jgi:DNA-binding MarR family transcriptional regulator
MKHPSTLLDDTIHQRVRLGILAVLNESRRVDFTYLRTALELTDGNLSRHLQILEDAGFVAITKEFANKRPRTWIAATNQGRSAFRTELSALKDLIHRVESPQQNSGRKGRKK